MRPRPIKTRAPVAGSGTTPLELVPLDDVPEELVPLDDVPEELVPLEEVKGTFCEYNEPILSPF